jgi:cytochrome c oxidase cbb3-type subunit 1
MDEPEQEGGAVAARHALGWLVAANALGVWLAALLLWPRLGELTGEASYGRILPVHLNWQLYGWSSLPLIGWLFAIYGVSRGSMARWAAPVVRAWSAVLVIGAMAWLAGGSSGKLFLDWKGGALAAFLVVLVGLWLVLAVGWKRGMEDRSGLFKISAAAALLSLAAVPIGLAMASSPSTYPPFDRTTGGPTGASLLGSTLPLVLILLLMPVTFGLPKKPGAGFRRAVAGWWMFEAVVFVALEITGGTHRMAGQILGLGLLLPWLALLPWDWCKFEWPADSGFWRFSTLAWWAVLVVSGWVDFLPGVLDRLKFTNSLVAHAHLAMAGFTSSLGLLLITLGGGPQAKTAVAKGGGWWHGSVGGHVVALAVCGWLESGSASWMGERPWWREMAFCFRLGAGVVMTLVAIYWWKRALGRRGERS